MRRLALAGVVVLLAGCGGGHKTSSPAVSASATSTSAAVSTSTPTSTVTPTNTTPAPAVHLSGGLRLTSSAFKPNGPIPKQYSCDGKDLQIPLRWRGVPKGTRELVLVMRDPDAPGGSFVHWALAGIPPAATSPPATAVAGANSFGTTGYRGPCPPLGDKPHHYVLTLSALAGPSGLKAGFSPDQLHAAALAIATLVGTYKRS